MARRRRGESVEDAVERTGDLRHRVEPRPDRRAKTRTRCLCDDRSAADAGPLPDRGVEDLHGFWRQLEHQRLVANHVTEQHPHGAALDPAGLSASASPDPHGSAG